MLQLTKISKFRVKKICGTGSPIQKRGDSRLLILERKSLPGQLSASVQTVQSFSSLDKLYFNPM
jgi:hypothetical protein